MECGHYYHIYNKGVNNSKLFFEKRNYAYFLKQFHKYLSNYLDIFSYCLMPNHFHFLVRINESIQQENNEIDSKILLGYNKLSPIEKAFRNLFMSYTKAINNAYSRTGDLFQSKFKRKIISDESYLTRLAAYIHLNPVRAKLCELPEQWKYSSYHEIINDKPSIINKDEVLSWFTDKEYFIEFHKNYQDYQIERDFIFKEENLKHQ